MPPKLLAGSKVSLNIDTAANSWYESLGHSRDMRDSFDLGTAPL